MSTEYKDAVVSLITDWAEQTEAKEPIRIKQDANRRPYLLTNAGRQYLPSALAELYKTI